MGAQHTASPWFWALDKSNQRTSLMRSGSGDYVICPQADVGDYGLSVNPWNDVSDADADLIAAAPNLLERLQAIIDWADFAMACPQEFDSHGVRNLDGPIFDDARALLAALATPVPQSEEK